MSSTGFGEHRSFLIIPRCISRFSQCKKCNLILLFKTCIILSFTCKNNSEIRNYWLSHLELISCFVLVITGPRPLSVPGTDKDTLPQNEGCSPAEVMLLEMVSSLWWVSSDIQQQHSDGLTQSSNPSPSALHFSSWQPAAGGSVPPSLCVKCVDATGSLCSCWWWLSPKESP